MSEFDELLELLGKEKEVSSKEWSKIPYRLILRITNEFFLLQITECKGIWLGTYFGRFKLDKTRTIFQIFSCFRISDSVKMNSLKLRKSLPIRIKGLSFEDVTPLPVSFFQHYKHLVMIERIKVKEPSIFGFLNEKLKALSFDMNLRNDVLHKIKRFENLRKLKIEFWCRHSISFDCDIDNPKLKRLCLSSNNVYNFWTLPESITFKSMSNLRVLVLSHITISNEQILRISELQNVKDLSLDEVVVDRNQECMIYEFFMMESIEILSLSFCEFNVKCLMNVLYMKDSKIEELRLCQISDLPHPFLEKLCFMKYLIYVNFICCDTDDILYFFEKCIDYSLNNERNDILKVDVGNISELKNEKIRELKKIKIIVKED